MTEERWTLTIRCPRPANRACDDWHVQPQRVERLARDWFGKNAEITLTTRTARLRLEGTGKPPIHLAHWQSSFATVLDCLFMEIERVRGKCVLPRPLRTEIREERGDR